MFKNQGNPNPTTIDRPNYHQIHLTSYFILCSCIKNSARKPLGLVWEREVSHLIHPTGPKMHPTLINLSLIETPRSRTHAITCSRTKGTLTLPPIDEECMCQTNLITTKTHLVLHVPKKHQTQTFRFRVKDQMEAGHSFDTKGLKNASLAEYPFSHWISRIKNAWTTRLSRTRKIKITLHHRWLRVHADRPNSNQTHLVSSLHFLHETMIRDAKLPLTLTHDLVLDLQQKVDTRIKA